MTNRLLAGCGGVTSAEHAYRIFEMAQLAEPEAHSLLAISNDWTRLPQHSPFRRALERFLAEFGHRAVYEADIANPRWIEDPTFVLEEVTQSTTPSLAVAQELVRVTHPFHPLYGRELILWSAADAAAKIV